MIEIYEHVAFVSYRFKPRFVTDEGGFLEFPFKCKTLSEKTRLAVNRSMYESRYEGLRNTYIGMYGNV